MTEPPGTEPSGTEPSGTAPPGRPLFRPGIGFTLFTALTIAVLLGLGLWQLQRLEWKSALIAKLEARQEAPPLTSLPPEPFDADALEHRRVTLTGRFLRSPEFRFPGRSHQGITGLHLALPFLLEDGRAILVNRGWIPQSQTKPDSRGFTTPDGRITIQGILRQGGWSGSQTFKPENDAQANNWFYYDLTAMAAQAGLQSPIESLYVIETNSAEDALPIATGSRITLANNHLLYALTWFALALALAIIYLLRSVRRPSA